ncbi:hypothetical protein ACVWXO_008125 [Bradyrhizobium sp. LM2.7]
MKLKLLKKLAYGIAAFLIIAFIVESLQSRPAGRTLRPDERLATEVTALDGQISCGSTAFWQRKFQTCADFQPPAKIAIGQHFRVAGRDLEIGAIIATKDASEQALVPDHSWYCEAAQTARGPRSRGQ